MTVKRYIGLLGVVAFAVSILVFFNSLNCPTPQNELMQNAKIAAIYDLNISGSNRILAAVRINVSKFFRNIC